MEKKNKEQKRQKKRKRKKFTSFKKYCVPYYNDFPTENKQQFLNLIIFL